MNTSGGDYRRVLLEVVRDFAARDALSSRAVLAEAAQRLGVRRNRAQEEALLTLFYDLFRSGHLSWGLNLDNPEPPHCHVTELGRRTLEHLSRDPVNPDGYLAHLTATSRLNPIALSYVKEALGTYGGGYFKGTAVLVGGAAESIVLEVRDEIVARITAAGKKPPKDMQDWRIKRVLDALESELAARRNDMPSSLRDSVESYWPAFTQQIRATRNDVGHPSSVDPVTPESVHAALLIFPELANLAYKIIDWAATHYR